MQARGFARYDVVVAMYHDQGLIPVKYLGIEDGVNITIGLPYVRTSPDHGTAFDIAGRLDAEGRGLADPRSLLGAIRHAHAMTAGPRRNLTRVRRAGHAGHARRRVTQRTVGARTP